MSLATRDRFRAVVSFEPFDRLPLLEWAGWWDLTMTRGEHAMRAELERPLPTTARGGFLISCDHQTPPGVSVQDYRLYPALFQEYAVAAGQLSARR